MGQAVQTGASMIVGNRILILAESERWIPPAFTNRSDDFVIVVRETVCNFEFDLRLDRIRRDIDDFVEETRRMITELKWAYREARESEARQIRHMRLSALPPPVRRRWKRRTCGEASRWRVMT